MDGAWRSLLHPEAVRRASDLRGLFASANPFRHVVIERFLDPAFYESLEREFPAFDDHFARNEFGETGRKAVRPDLSGVGDDYARLDGLLRAPEFLELLGEITSIPELLYDPDYVGGGAHENLDGQELDPHVDFNYHPTTLLHRRINLILFLNPEWEVSWGGCLELQSDPALPASATEARIIAPLANRCVIFETTERSWHGFPKISFPSERKQMSRRSVAVYYYTSERPSAETAPSHSTVYVQRPMPERIAAGYTLQHGDVDEIRNLLRRRDKQIEFLYEREKSREGKIRALIESVRSSPAFRLSRALTWPGRTLRSWLGGKS